MNDTDQEMQIAVQGHPVTLRFAEKPNLQIAEQVKQALLMSLIFK